MPAAEQDGLPIGPDVVDRSSAREEVAAASRAELERCLAAGMPLDLARIEASKEAARARRVQIGLEPEEPDFYVPPAQRLRFDAAGRVVPPKTGRVRPRG